MDTNANFGAIDRFGAEITASEFSRRGPNRAGARQDGGNATSAKIALALVFATIMVAAVTVLAGGKRYDLFANSEPLRFFPGCEKPVRATKRDRLDTDSFSGIFALDKG